MRKLIQDADKDLFDAYSLGNVRLANRCVMAPMTRSRAISHSPDESTVTYYRQRASAGLVITEGTVVSPQGRGYLWTPGIYTEEQIDGWKNVTRAVHQAGGKIFVQLWHVGRMSHITLQQHGDLPVSSVSSQIMHSKVFAYDKNGNAVQLPPSPARALEIHEIQQITQDFVNAAKSAMNAGFDGVEIHAANGYLFDQFINGGLNTRNDNYGGESRENRLRFVLDTVDAVVNAIGADRVGVRVSPFAGALDLPDYQDEFNTQVTLAKALNERNIVYLHLNDLGATDAVKRAIRAVFLNTLILCGGYDKEKAQSALKEGRADCIAFGRPFISNPDLVDRMRHERQLAPIDKSDFYGGGDKGYIDFPDA